MSTEIVEMRFHSELSFATQDYWTKKTLGKLAEGDGGTESLQGHRIIDKIQGLVRWSVIIRGMGVFQRGGRGTVIQLEKGETIIELEKEKAVINLKEVKKFDGNDRDFKNVTIDGNPLPEDSN